MDWDNLEKEAYAYLGLTPHEFYEFTPREYENMLKGYQIKREMDLKDRQYQAWFNANFVGLALSGEELPKLEDIMTLSSVSEKTTKDSNADFIKLADKANIKIPQELRDKYLKD